MILIIDTETTGMDNPRVVEIAVAEIPDIGNMDDVTMMVQRVKPPVEIEIGAMATHNITDEMLEDCPEYANTDICDYLINANNPSTTVVIHNANYDLGVLKNEGLENNMMVIDTLKCCKVAFMGNHSVEMNLQYLKYLLKLHKEEVPQPLTAYSGTAHGAAADVVTLYLLFRRMLKRYSLEWMINTTANPILYEAMPFGKHKGVPIRELAAKDRGYALWVLKNIDDQDILYSFKYWMKGKAEI